MKNSLFQIGSLVVAVMMWVAQWKLLRTARRPHHSLAATLLILVSLLEVPAGLALFGAGFVGALIPWIIGPPLAIAVSPA